MNIEEEIARIIDEGMADRGRYVAEWPDDEAEAYRELGWSEGAAAARALQVSKTAAALMPPLNRVWAGAWSEGFAAGRNADHNSMWWPKNPYREEANYDR